MKPTYLKEVCEVGGACTSHGKYRNPYKVLKWEKIEGKAMTYFGA